MLPIRSLNLVDSNITQTLTGWTYFLHFPVTGRVARAFSGVFYIGSNKGSDIACLILDCITKIIHFGYAITDKTDNRHLLKSLILLAVLYTFCTVCLET